MLEFPLFPDQASSIAGDVDAIYFALVALSLVFTAGVVIMIVFFAVKYRSGAQVDRSNPSTGNIPIEVTWMVIPAFLGVGMFAWAAVSYFDMKKPPPGNAMQMYVIGKQWMWKVQHPSGTREINTLHVPRGAVVKLQMTSQDVIHSFFVPAFRVKQDVLPGRYTDMWFKATKTGKYRIFCAEYCGTEHSYMKGWVHVMEPAKYEKWLRTGATGGSNTTPGTGRLERAPSTAPDAYQGDRSTEQRGAGETAPSPGTPGPGDQAIPEEGTLPPTGREDAMAAAGRQLFQELRCNACHRVDSTALYPAQGPVLQDVYGHPVELQNNRTIIADDEYIRESIVYPQAKLVAGYPPLMPTFKGQISETELLQLVAFIKSLSTDTTAAAPSASPADTARALPAPADTVGSEGGVQ